MPGPGTSSLVLRSAAGHGRRSRRAPVAVAAAVALAAAGLSALTVTAASPASAAVRTVGAARTVTMRAGVLGADGISAHELAPGEPGADAAGPEPSPGPPAATTGAVGVRSAANVLRSFDGLTSRQQRLANGGNQFSVEPPDQGLCVGNGFVLESVNDVLRVFHRDGTPATGVVDLNSFYGYAAQINRTTGDQGPFVTDPTCLFDPDTQRFFHVVLTLDVDPASGAFLGTNHLDLAVSQTADPTGAWRIYTIPVQDDGTQGTPDHGCKDDKGGPGPCIGDFPHIGADANGLFLTTNEYDLFGPNFHAAQIYALSKRALAAGRTSTLTQIDTVGLQAGKPGFTVWPAQAPAGQNSRAAGGTEYFLSSNAAEEATGVPGGTASNQLVQWTLSNTRSLDSATPNVRLRNRVHRVGLYSPPPKAEQKAGSTPLVDCLNDTTTVTPAGTGCWQLFFDAANEPAHDETESPLDASDSRIQGVVFADGKVWGSLDTAVVPRGDSAERAGIETFVVDPAEGRARSGYVAVKGNNVTYGAVGATGDGKALLALTLVGRDHYPSAAYVRVGDDARSGAVQVIAEGVGPQDGFSGTKAFNAPDPARPRWGDYGATALDGRTLWLASEYIAQTCTLAQYLTAPIGSCNGTRVALTNWATRVSQVRL